MHQQPTPTANSEIVVARGYSIKVRVENRHLILEDGIGRHRRTRRFHRTSKLLRLVLIGRSGYVTLDALRWLNDVGAAVVHLDTNGRLTATSTAKGADLAGLRRAQALAAGGPAGLEVARGVLTAKVQGQLDILKELPEAGAAVPAASTALKATEDAQDLTALLVAEARAADAYWQAWAPLPIPFPHTERARLPQHWLTFGQRASLLTGGPRVATNPAGAILNYLYALLEAETILACHVMGLDPGLGIFHTDRRDRASLALDLMEAARPAVDAYVLALLTQRTLSTRDFAETREGACRLSAQLTSELAGTSDTWRRQIAPVVEWAAHTLSHHATSPISLRTPLTRRNRRHAWDQRAPDRRPQSKQDFVQLPHSCRECGTPLRDGRRRYCDNCRGRRFQELAPRGRERAAEVLARLRAEQRDPAHGGSAAESRGRKNAGHQAAVRDWTGGRSDAGVFQAEILPGLRDVSIGELVAATGLSEHYCSLIRLGKRVPHQRHWDALRLTQNGHRSEPSASHRSP
ncbi:MAG: CRISPR-associated endonuclease Cas1 [Solirubrobacteraceae bacterium]